MMMMLISILSILLLLKFIVIYIIISSSYYCYYIFFGGVLFLSMLDSAQGPGTDLWIPCHASNYYQFGSLPEQVSVGSFACI